MGASLDISADKIPRGSPEGPGRRLFCVLAWRFSTLVRLGLNFAARRANVLSLVSFRVKESGLSLFPRPEFFCLWRESREPKHQIRFRQQNGASQAFHGSRGHFFWSIKGLSRFSRFTLSFSTSEVGSTGFSAGLATSGFPACSPSVGAAAGLQAMELRASSVRAHGTDSFMYQRLPTCGGSRTIMQKLSLGYQLGKSPGSRISGDLLVVQL